jgi:dipeptidyl aminopeptidase/acylaminoacyl peptidase
MKRIVVTLLLLVFAFPALAQRRPITFEDLAAVRRVGPPALSPDGKWIAYELSTIDLEANRRLSAIYLISAAGGAPRKITEGSAQDENPVWSPDGKTIAYVSNQQGNPKQIYLLEVASGTTRQLSRLLHGASMLKWVPDGSGLVLVSDIYPDCGVVPDCAEKMQEAQEKSPVRANRIDSLLYRHWNSWQAATRTHILFHPLDGPPRDLTPGTFDAPPFSVGARASFDVSPDSTELVYASNTDPDAATSTNSDLFIVPLAGGEPLRITTRTGADDSPAYSPDGRFIAYRSQARPGYESDLWELHLYDRKEETSRRLAENFPYWVDSIRWLPDGKSLIVTALERGKNAMFEVRLRDQKWSRLYAQGSASGVQISPDGRNRLYFQRSSLIRPAEIFSLGWRAEAANQLTRENDPLLAQLTLGEVSEFWTKGADATLIHSLMVKPPGFDPGQKHPGLVLIHGGPQSAFTDSWGYRWNPQLFAARGYVVLMPNPRGSTGYGQSFVEQISRDWAGKVYEDLMNAVEVFGAFPYIDSSRLGAAGGSYGGYMVNWILGHSDRFRALLSHAGIFNLTSFYGATEELWFPEWEFGGAPWDNPEMYERWSPHRFVLQFKTPTLVSHGELDFRVPIGEGLQLFTALQRRGVPSRLLYFPDEGHWILKPLNSRLWYQTVLDWFDSYLKADGTFMPH